MSGFGRAKEGHSIFGILNRTRSYPGAKLLRSWLCLPRIDLEEILERQNAVDLLSSLELRDIVENLGTFLKGVNDCSRIIQRLQSFTASVLDWEKLFQTSLSCIKIRETAGSHPLLTRAQVFRSMLEECKNEKLRSIVDAIDKVIDFQESKKEKRLVIKAGFSPDLDELHQSYSSLADFLTSVGIEELRRFGEEASIVRSLPT